MSAEATPNATVVTPPAAPVTPTPPSITDETKVEWGGKQASLKELREAANRATQLEADLRNMASPDPALSGPAAQRVLRAQGMNDAQIAEYLKGFNPGEDDDDDEVDPTESAQGKKGKGAVDEEARRTAESNKSALEALAQERLMDIRARRDDIIDTAMESMTEVKALMEGLDPEEDADTIKARTEQVRQVAVARFAQKAKERATANGGRWDPSWLKPLTIESMKEATAQVSRFVGKPKGLGRGSTGGSLENNGRLKRDVPKLERGKVLSGGLEAYLGALLENGLSEQPDNLNAI